MKNNPGPTAGQPWSVPILLIDRANYTEPIRSDTPPAVHYSLDGRRFAPFSAPPVWIPDIAGEPSGFWIQPITASELDRPGVLIILAETENSAQWRDIYHVATGDTPPIETHTGHALAPATIARSASDSAQSLATVSAPQAGSALASARLATVEPGQPPPAMLNLLKNGDFSAGLEYWQTYAKSEPATDDPILIYATSLEAGPACVIEKTTPARLINAQLYQNRIQLEAQAYRLRARLHNPISQTIPLGIFIHEHGKPYTNLGLDLNLEIPPGDYELDRVFMASASANARLRFWLAALEDGDELEIHSVALTPAL